MDEVWKPIAEYEGYYEVSNAGRVRSLDRVLRNGRLAPGRVLRATTNSRGYLLVSLYRDSRERKVGVHRLVARAFHGPGFDGAESCHINGDPTDNRSINLRWGTKSANRIDSVHHGTHHHARKTRCPLGHLLVTPNLVASKAAKGNRACLCCARARATASNKGLPFSEAEAHERYRSLIHSEMELANA